MAYIERESAIKSLLNDCLGQVSYSREDAADCIFWLDTADVAPVRHGRWLGWGKSGTPTYENYGTCSVCGEDAEIYTEHRNFCPNCGAKMDGGETNGINR